MVEGPVSLSWANRRSATTARPTSPLALTREEYLDWDKLADMTIDDAPIAQYATLPRLIDRAEESKAYTAPVNYHTRDDRRRRAKDTIEEATVLINEMKDRDMPVTTSVLNEMLRVFGRAKDFDSAMEYLETAFDPSSGTTAPNGRTYRILVEMYVFGNRVDRALEIKDDMLEAVGVAPDLEVYGFLIRKLAHQRRREAALMLFKEARSLGLQPRERTIRELRRLCAVAEDRAGLSLLGDDPEAWRKEVAIARRSKDKKSAKAARKLQNMLRF